MIENDGDLLQSIDAMKLMYKALRNLKVEMLPQNPLGYWLMTEGPRDFIKKIQRDIDEYCGVRLARKKRPKRKSIRAGSRQLVHRK